MAGRAEGLIVVIDASTFVSAALKADSLPERALLRAVDPPNRLILSQEVEDEYREVIFRPNFLGCRHATYLDLRDLTDPVEIPERDAATVLIFEKGIEHEKRHPTSLKARGFTVVEVAGEGFDLAGGTAHTREAMRARVAAPHRKGTDKEV
jgi:hypothetical protein